MKYALGNLVRAIHFMRGIPMQIKRLKKQGQEPVGNKENYYNHGIFLCVTV